MSTATAQLDLGHLRPAARRHALEDDDTRIRRIRSDRFVPFARAVEGLKPCWKTCSPIQNAPACPTCLIHADAGMGKTMLAAKFRRDHPPSFDAATRRDGDTGDLCGDAVGAGRGTVLHAAPGPSISAPIEPRATLARKEAMALRILPQLKPGMLMIDEVQHLLSGSYRQQRQALNLIKSLGNQLRVPIVALGTQDALQVIRTDPQVQSRFWTFEMTRWGEDGELRALLATIETV